MLDAEYRENVRTLDPFGFLVGQGSAIRPLGGEERSPDPRYVFHTPYVEFRPGRVTFTIRFEGLQASFGELRVDINAQIPGSGRDAIFVTSSRLLLADRETVERGLTISIVSVAGATYAAFGFCADGTDARAEGLSITAEQAGTADDALAEEPLPPSPFGTAVTLQTPARLIGDGSPSFRDPVSQPMTDAQLAEPEYRNWISRLKADSGEEQSRWRVAFIAQVLDRYGMLREGGRGIALGGEGVALAPIIAAAKCEALIASLPNPPAATDFAWRAIPCAPLDAPPGADGALPGIPLSMLEQAGGQRGFDFCWSIGLAGQAHAAGHRASFLDELMAVLRPNGYAIHMFELALTDGAPKDSLPRDAVERLAVTLISRGFSVAQLNFGGIVTRTGSVPFGLIVRKN